MPHHGVARRAGASAPLRAADQGWRRSARRPCVHLALCAPRRAIHAAASAVAAAPRRPPVPLRPLPPTRAARPFPPAWRRALPGSRRVALWPH
eukprot:scaffold251398_cov31-Tisochrysis_lutea.AAC.2